MTRATKQIAICFSLLVVTLLLLLATAHTAAQANIGEDVTSNLNVTQDISIAQNYWRENDPSVPTSCDVKVVIENMVDTEVEGVKFPASNVWAETPLFGCQISMSEALWNTVTKISASIQFLEGVYSTPFTMLCQAIVHEYGHVIGLDDTFKNNGIMNPYAPANDVPACNSVQKIYTQSEIEENQRWEYAVHQKLIEREETEAASAAYEKREHRREHREKENEHRRICKKLKHHKKTRFWRKLHCHR